MMLRYALQRTVAPTQYPVSLAEAKAHVKQDFDTDDAMLAAQIIAATELVESFTKQQMMTATYELTLDSFPDVIRVPKPPLQSVTSITYLDTGGTSQTVASTDYTVDIKSEPGRIMPVFGAVWPVTYQQMNAVTVTYVAGRTKVGDVPEALKAGIKLLIGDLYQNRETMFDGTIEEMPTIRALLWPYVREWTGAADRYPGGYSSWKQEFFS
jgi:uncharacterized phiE125 gp8 family phage protein